MNRMFKLFSVLVVFVMVYGFSFIGEAAQKKVAVMPFESISGSVEHRIAEIMTDQITVALHNSGIYTVVERTQLAQAIKEINLQNSGVIDASQAIALGRMTGTDYTIVGKVLLARVVDNEAAKIFGGVLGGKNPYGVGGYIPKYKGKVALDVRFVENATGEVVFAQVIEGSKCGNDKADCLDKACKDAAMNTLFKLRTKNPLTATVLYAEHGKAIIDKGIGTGLQKGDVLIAYQESKPVKGLNGEIVTVISEAVGKVKVVEVNDKHSVCKVVSGGERIKRFTRVKGA